MYKQEHFVSAKRNCMRKLEIAKSL